MNHRVSFLLICGWLLLHSTPGSSATVKFTLSGRVMPGNFSGGYGQFHVDAVLNGQTARIENDCIDDLYCDDLFDFCCGGPCSIPTPVSQITTLNCGQAYTLTVVGRSCGTGVNVAFTEIGGITAANSGYIVEIKDDQTSQIFDKFNINNITIGSGQTKTWTVTLKPRQVLFDLDPVTPANKSLIQAKPSFANGAGHWFTGTPIWSIAPAGGPLGCTIDSTGLIRVGSEEGEITVIATDGVSSRKATGVLRLGCTTCDTGSCGPGQGRVVNKTYALSVGLGAAGCAEGWIGSIRLKLTSPIADLTTPAGLIFDNLTPEVIRDIGRPGLNQVKAPQSFVNVVITANPNPEYDIKVYWPENSGSKSGGLYQPLDSPGPFKVWRVTRLASDNTQFSVTEDPAGANPIVNTFTWNAGDNGWTLNRSALRQEKKIVLSGLSGGNPPEVANSRRTETIEISTPGSPTVIASKTRKTFATLSLNGGAVQRPDVLVEERVYGQKADDSAANPDQVTSYFYATTATGDNHEKVQRVSRSDGSWEHYEYDGNHRVSTVYTPWLDSIPPGDVNTAPTLVAHRKTAYDYTLLTDDVGTDLVTPRRVEVYVKESAGATPQLVSRDFVQFTTDTTVYPRLDVRKDISCRSSTAQWNDVNNPVTTTRSLADGPFKKALHSVDRPDGTRSVYSYTETSEQVSQGAPGAGYTVNDGRMTITTRTPRGYTDLTEVFDIVAGKKLLSDDWSVPGVGDPQGRFTLLTHLDGTTETFTYDCCNLTQTVARDGATTVYTPDALNRVWKTTVYYSAALVNGIETRNTFDASGNVTKITRVGGASIDVVPLREYDRGGRLIREQNALLGYTIIVETVTANGGRKVTTAYPDTGTRIEEYNRDGRLAKVTGTAAQPVQYEYGLDATSLQLYVKEIKLNAVGSPTDEWAKTYTDFLGRGVKTVYADATGTEADNAYSQQYYKDNGQLWKERDPDGVLTVYIYNTRGQVEYTMVGLKTDPSTPPTAPDTTGEHRVTRVENRVSTYPEGPTYDTLMTKVTEWTTLNSGATIVSSESHTSLNGLRQWNVAYPNDTFRQVVKTLTQYGTGSKTVTVTAPDNSYQISTFSYGRPSTVAYYKSGGATVVSTTYQYDSHGRLWKSTDARNGITTFIYNNADQAITVVTPAPASGLPAQTRSTLYDTMGRATQVTEPDGGIVYNRYYKNGLVKLTWGVRAYPNGYVYDAQGRVTTLYTWQTFTAPNPADADPPFPSGSVATLWHYHQYRGWLQDKRYPDNKGPDYEYTPGGRLKKRTWWRDVPGNPGIRLATTYTYDFDTLGLNANRMAGYLAKVDYNDSIAGQIPTAGLTFDYDRRGRGRTVAQAAVPPITTTLTRHPSGALDSESYAGNFLDTLSVVAGNVEAGNNLLRRVSLEARKASVAIAGTAVSYGYDTALRLESVTSSGFSVTYGYAPNSHLRSTDTFKQVQGANTRLTTTRQFDYLNRQQSITHAASAPAQPPLSHAYVYNDANQRVARVDGNLTSWGYAYDNKGQVTAAKHSWSAGELIPGQQFEYGYDEIGNRLQAREGGDQNGGSLRQTTYVPDNLNRYTSRSMSVADRKIDIMGLALVQNGIPSTVTINTTLTPDYRRGEYFWKALAGSGAGPNWLTVNVTAGSSSAAGGAYVLPQSESFGYDDDGNLTSDSRWLYKWDAENRLARIETRDTAAAVGVPPKRIQNTYDYRSRLIRRQVFSGTYGAGVITWSSSPDTALDANLIFLYDNMECIAALKPDQTLFQAYVWGLDLSGTLHGAGGVGGLVMFRRAVGASTDTYFPTYDGNGNVTGLVKGEDAGLANSAGTVVARYEYGPFGQLLRISGEPVALDNPFRFSTKWQDGQSDLLYYGFRYYAPSTGKWLSRDPMLESGGINLYSFGNNNPLSSVDVDGRIPLDTLLDLGFLAYDLATGSGAATIATDIASLVIPYVPNPRIAVPLIKPVRRLIDGEFKEVQIVERAGLRETKLIERNPLGRNPKLTVRFEYKGLSSHPQGQNYPKHFKKVTSTEADALGYTAANPNDSQWRIGFGDRDVRRLIDQALEAYGKKFPQPHYSTLNGYVHDFALPTTRDKFIDTLGSALSKVGYSGGKCTTKIKLDVGLGGEIHAYPVP